MSLSLDSHPHDWLADLPQTPASDVKKLGWRGVMKSLRHAGRLVVTNHNEPEAVILSAGEYAVLMQRAEQSDLHAAAALETLRQRFDQRLAALEAPDAGDRLRAALRGGTTLNGEVKAGAGY